MIIPSKVRLHLSMVRVTPIAIVCASVYTRCAVVIRYASAVVTLAGILALISGLVIWYGAAPSLVSMHMLLGFLTVAGLWTIGIVQVKSAGGSSILAALAVIVGALTIYIGMNQTAILPGEHHWLIQIGHVILGILNIGLAHMAAARQRRAAAR
jgi:hypothetical protein